MAVQQRSQRPGLQRSADDLPGRPRPRCALDHYLWDGAGPACDVPSARDHRHGSAPVTRTAALLWTASAPGSVAHPAMSRRKGGPRRDEPVSVRRQRGDDGAARDLLEPGGGDPAQMFRRSGGKGRRDIPGRFRRPIVLAVPFAAEEPVADDGRAQRHEDQALLPHTPVDQPRRGRGYADGRRSRSPMAGLGTHRCGGPPFASTPPAPRPEDARHRGRGLWTP
jgi:hypothetical protein